MTSFALLVERAYFALAPKRALLFIFLALFIACAGHVLSKAEVSTSSRYFFPEGSVFSQYARGMELLPLSRLIAIEIAFKDGASKERLLREAHRIQEIIPGELATPPKSFLPPASLFPALFPVAFSDEVREQVKKRSEDAWISRTIRKDMQRIAAFTPGEAVLWIREDPLEWRDIFLGKFASWRMLPEGVVQSDSEGCFLKEDAKRALLLFEPTKAFHDADYATALDSAIQHALSTLPKDMQGFYMAAARHTASNTRAIHGDIAWILCFSLLGLVTLYAFFSRSIGAFWLFLTPCVACSISMGLLGIFFPVLSGLALGFGCAVLGISEDYAVHMHFALRSPCPKEEALKALASPLLQGLILNATGFFLLLFSALPAIRQLAALSLTSLTAGFLLALFILPHCPYFDSPKLFEETPRQGFSQSPSLWKILCFVFFLAMGASLLLHWTRYDVSPRSLGADMEAIMADARHLHEEWFPDTGSVVLVEEKSEEELLTRLSDVERRIQLGNPKAHCVSMADFLPSLAIQRENCGRFARFLEENGRRIQEALRIHSQESGLDPAFFAPFLSFLESVPKTVTLQDLETIGLHDVRSRLIRFFPRENVYCGILMARDVESLPNLPEGALFYDARKMEEALQGIFYEESRFVPYALCLSFCLLLIFLRSLSRTLLAALPALLGVFFVLLFFLVMEMPITLASLSAFPLLIGLALDHGIMVVHSFASGYTLHISRAMVLSSLTACTGMGLLAFSRHPALAHMGWVLLIGLLVEIVSSIYLLPLFYSKKVAIRLSNDKMR